LRNCIGQGQRSHEVGEIIGQRVQLKTHRVRDERAARQPRPLDRALALLDPLLARPALVVEGDDPLGRARQIGDDEANARTKLARTAGAAGVRVASAAKLHRFNSADMSR
jgi:hypothetical protein